MSMRGEWADREIVLIVLALAILGVLAFRAVAVGLYESRTMKAYGK